MAIQDAKYYYDQHKYLEAIVSYDKAIALNPDYVVAYFGKGNALKDLGKTLDAIKAYDKAIEINPDYAPAYCNKGVVLSALGKNLEAIVSYDEAIALNPDYAEAYYSKGIALKDLDGNLEAIKAYDKAISIRPEALYYCAKGKILNEIGREQEALACFNKAFQMSKEGKVQAGKDNLSKGNVEYINKALSEDRGALIEKLSKLQSLSNDVKSTIDALGWEDDAKEEIIQEFTRLKRAQTLVMGEVIDGFVA